MKKIYLVDVSNMFFRAFYAIPRLTNSKGMPTNALYGFVGMIIKLLRDNKPDYMAFCLDQKDGSFRDELYTEYKANRVELPEDMEPQFPYMRQILDVLGLPILEMTRFEADDVIGTLAKQAASRGIEAVIVSGDKDFAQLVDEHISLYDTMKNIRYGRAGVIEKWGIPPEQMIDYLSIVGDTSDNIPGIKGVGPKGAVKLLTEFKTLEDIYKGIDSIKSESLKSKIVESKEQAYLAKKLVTIVTDVPLKVEIENLKQRELDRDAVDKLFTELDFTALIKKVFDAADAVAQASSAPVQPVRPSDDNRPLIRSIPRVPAPAATDMAVAATVAVAPAVPAVEVEVVSLGLAELAQKFEAGASIWAAVTDKGFCFADSENIYQVNARIEEIGPILSAKKLKWSGFNIKSIWKYLGISNATCEWDTMLAAYVIRPKPVEAFADVYKILYQAELPDLLSSEQALKLEMQAQAELQKRLVEFNGVSVYLEMELPIVPILHGMEQAGILIDKAELARQSKTLETDVAVLEKKIHELAGGPFNIASPKQLGAILFEKLQIPVVKKTKTGYSTDSDVLGKLAEKYPIAALITEYRELSKLKSTYVDALPLLVDPKDDRIHTTFEQALTATGRLSSNNPNLQNIPIRTDRGRMIRKAFIAKKDHVLLAADYSQIELRVLAEIAADPGLIEAFKKGHDVHAATAAEVFDVPLDQVTSDQRRMAKAVNFGIAYGQGAFGLAETLGISRSEAKTIIDNYFIKFPNIQNYMSKTIDQAKERFYVETLFGRRRYLDELRSSMQMIRKFGERAAVNAPMQGTASDIVKKAMIGVHDAIQAGKIKATMVLQVHDELLFECKADQAEEQAKIIKSIMENVVQLSVPMVVNVAWGTDWESAHS
jgi:DNA polymerase I